MRIVHFSTHLSRSAGGLYFSVSGLARAQARLGAKVTVIGGADHYFETDRHVWDGVELQPFPSRDAYGFHAPSLARSMASRPDIMHIHGIWSAASIHGAWTRARGVVVSPRGMLDPWILARKRRIKTIHAALFERPLLRRAHVHALTESEAGAALAFMPKLSGRTFVLPNGLDGSDIVPAGSRNGALFLGRLHEKKQVVELVRAWRRLRTGVTLRIAGWGDPQYERLVHETAEDAGNIDVVGSRYGEAKAAALSSARFFILPSLSEGLPMAVLEALHHGCIPILTDGCNLPHLFDNGVATRMAADFSDFEIRMKLLLGEGELALHRRSEASRQAARAYLWPGIAANMLGQYERILGERSAP